MISILAHLLTRPQHQPLISCISKLQGRCRVRGPSSRLPASPMNTILSRVNPTTGTSEWVVEDATYDFHQEIARSAYTDMLHDDERNKKYYEAIRRAIKLVHDRGEQANVLDIGTGTGLLSMMAAESGADTVHACEAFEPIANVAKKIIAENGFADRINVISKRSTQVTVGPEGDIPHRANILPAEVFDTELIGEGAVPTYLHAHQHLLEKDAICVPHSATVWAQVVQSDLVWSWHKLRPIRTGDQDDDVIQPPPKMAACPGAAAVHDLQLGQLPLDRFRPVTEPLEAIGFDFSRGDGDGGFARRRRSAAVKTAALSDGPCHAVFVWWELCMDTEGAVRLSTAPPWAHPQGGEAQWRDHWMQAIYFLDRALPVRKGEPLYVTLSHDDYSLWFNVSRSSRPDAAPERPVCRCGAHVAWSRPRLGMLNDAARTHSFARALRKVVNDKTMCISVSDGSLLPLIAAKVGAKKVYSLEPSAMFRRVIRDIVEVNDLTEKVVLCDEGALNLTPEYFKGQKIDVLMGEPFFHTSILPWNNLHFWYARTALAPHLAEGALVLPGRARLRGVAAEFDHLWKFYAPAGRVEGFDVRLFDKLVKSSAAVSDAPTEPHHLWEYPGRALSQDFHLMEFDFGRPVPTDVRTESGTVEILGQGTCHGVALWMEYQLDRDTWVSTGLQRPVPPSPTRDLAWDRHSKQGVYFFKTNPRVDAGARLRFNVSFNPSHGSVHFKFEVV